MFFIAGITGHVGGAAARRLLAKGKQVRSLLRKPEKATAFKDQGVEIQKGDLNDPNALARALEGVEGAFLLMQPTMTPPADFSDAKASLASYKTALKIAPVPRLVALSSMGSEKNERLGNITSTSLMERALSDLPFPTALCVPARSTRTTAAQSRPLSIPENTSAFSPLISRFPLSVRSISETRLRSYC